MKKNVKWLAALAVVGTIIGMIIVYFCKKKSEASEFDEDDFEDEDDFDLDGDLKPVSERGYVPLNKAADPAQKEETEDSKDGEEEKEDTAEAAEPEDESAPAPEEADVWPEKEASSEKE